MHLILKFSAKELMCKLRQLECHVKQLQNIVIKREVSTTPPLTIRHRRTHRVFDFSKYNTRHVALKIMYLGTGYTGYAGLGATDNTIEKVLFEALMKTKLIENKEAAVASYTKSGRTDKGVNAFGQVVALDLRTNLTCGVGVKIREDGTALQRPGDKDTEIQYCHILNKVLPLQVRVLAWAPVNVEFSARFSCKKRTYKYFFAQGNLNIELMNEATQRLIGEHDFRNFCKISESVNNFVRRIYSAEVKVTEHKEGGYSMCEFSITATAYLWHQIRCIMGVLILIGQGREKPEVIDELLDIDKNLRRPQYHIAADFPLCLYDADFGDDLEWIYERAWHEDNIKTLQQLWAESSIKACMLKMMLESLDQTNVKTECGIAPWSDRSQPLLYQTEGLILGSKYRVYKPIMERPTCESVEYRQEHAAKRRKLNSGGADDTYTVEENGILLKLT